MYGEFNQIYISTAVFQPHNNNKT